MRALAGLEVENDDDQDEQAGSEPECLEQRECPCERGDRGRVAHLLCGQERKRSGGRRLEGARRGACFTLHPELCDGTRPVEGIRFALRSNELRETVTVDYENRSGAGHARKRARLANGSHRDGDAANLDDVRLRSRRGPTSRTAARAGFLQGVHEGRQRPRGVAVVPVRGTCERTRLDRDEVD